MSLVTNVILVAGILEYADEPDGNFEKINEWCREHMRGQGFGPDPNTTSVVGGHKALEADVRIAAFNYFLEDEFMELLRGLDWEYPDELQVFIQRQEEYRFSLLHPLVDSTQPHPSTG